MAHMDGESGREDARGVRELLEESYAELERRGVPSRVQGTSPRLDRPLPPPIDEDGVLDRVAAGIAERESAAEEEPPSSST